MQLKLNISKVKCIHVTHVFFFLFVHQVIFVSFLLFIDEYFLPSLHKNHVLEESYCFDFVMTQQNHHRS